MDEPTTTPTVPVFFAPGLPDCPPPPVETNTETDCIIHRGRSLAPGSTWWTIRGGICRPVTVASLTPYGISGMHVGVQGDDDSLDASDLYATELDALKVEQTWLRKELAFHLGEQAHYKRRLDGVERRMAEVTGVVQTGEVPQVGDVQSNGHSTNGTGKKA